MCGIAGIIGHHHARVRDALLAMTACQAHRGPDDQGIELLPFRAGTPADAPGHTPGPFLGLGQRRLSIIDLSPAGHQPMLNPATGDALIYNGELYNFQRLRDSLRASGRSFRGHSDTEVILYALRHFGPKAIEEMQGMFAFAFFDRQAGTLLLARDPMGIKPLYIAETSDGGIIFASEVRALLASGLISRDIDPAALAGMLAHGSVPEPLTFFKSIRAFPPGCSQLFKLGPGDKVVADGPPTPHWYFPTLNPALDEQAACAALRTTLDDAVRDHLISDVPVGVFLSSGLDSTLVAALAARHSPKMRCFTVGFADAPDMSESPAAARTAAQFGLEHRDIQVTGQTAQDSMERWLRAMDQPSLDGLNTFIVSQAVRKEGIIVALSGLGGDELLGGYPSFETLPALHAANRRLRALPSSARAALFALAGVGRPGQVRDKLADMGRTGPDLLRLYIHRRRAMSDKRLAALGLSAAAVGLDDVFIPKAALAAAHAGAPKGADADHLAAIARYECSFYMRNVLLRDSDANGMAHSLEIRVPMLDRRVLDLCHAIPGKVRLPSGRADKHLLRTAFKDLLRPELLNQTKKGFTLPIRRWMSGPLRPMCEAAVSKVKDSGLVSPSGVDTIWRTFLAQPEMQVWSSALALVALGSYLTQSCTKPPAPPR